MNHRLCSSLDGLLRPLRRWWLLAAASSALVLIPSAAIAAPVPTSTGTQLPGSGTADAVAIDGSTALQGGGRTGTGVANHTVDIFQRTLTGWSKVTTLTPPSGDTHSDRFGEAVAVSNGTAAVGSGSAVYVYVRNPAGHWSLRQEIDPPADDTGTGSNGPIFGWWAGTVDIDGSTLVVSDPGNNNDLGTAWIYTLSNGTWSETKELDGVLTGITVPFFGSSLDVRGSELIVGAPGGSTAYIYRGGGSTWTLEATVSSPPVNGEWFGAGVAIEGDTAAIGLGFGTTAPLIMGPGPQCALAHESCSNVFVYQHVPGTQNWQLVSNLTTAGFDDPTQPFGGLTALDGSRLVSGAYVFQNVAPGVWRPYEELQPHSPVPTCYSCGFGTSVGVSGTTEIVNGGGENSAVYP